MNSPIHMQLIKWTVPAVAFAIALFWYRRRRIDRVQLERNDPGGDAKLNREDNVILNHCKELDTSHHDSDVQEKAKRFSTRYNCSEEEEEEEEEKDPTRVSTKTSESTEMSMDMTPSVTFNFNDTINEQCTNTFNRHFSMPPCELDNTEQITNVLEDNGAEQIAYDQTQSSQQQYIANEYNYEGDNQHAKEHIENTINTQGHIYERDSANHSPVSGVLEDTVTPDETRSEGSMDSGKGGSINENRKNNVVSTTYDFAIPQHLVGRLIGRHGSFLHSIRAKTNVAIYVNDHPYDGDHKICSIQGNTDEINGALKIIRQKFPEKKFPEVTLTEISTVSETITDTIPYVSNWTALSLIDGVNNDVIVSHVVKPNWLFVNLPTHPTYLSLQNLESEMLLCYGDATPAVLMKQPAVIQVVKQGDYVAVPWNKKWARAYVQKPDPTGERHIVRLVDYGGYWIVGMWQMRPLLSNFMILPFQAIEVFLANIESKNGNGIWLHSAYNLIHHICKSGVGQAQVEGYIEDNVYTNIYYTFNNCGVFSLADELRAKGFAKPITWEHMQPEKIEAAFSQ